MPTEAEQIAAETIKVLDMQKAYYRTRTGLIECKAAEAALRVLCEVVLGKQTQPQALFDI